MMLDEVYGPIGIHHMPMSMTKETARVLVPQLGWGGNIIQLMPNGMIGFRAGNAGDDPGVQMMIVADKIRQFDKYAIRQPIIP
jgi:hypothetical protein